MTASSRVLWLCCIWCDSFSSQIVIAVAFGTACRLFFISSLKYTHTLTKMWIYICTHAHRETNTEWLSSAFYLLNQFSKLQHCSLFLFKMPEATFPTLLISLPGCRAFDKARPSTLPSVGCTLLNACLQVGRSALPLITRQLGLRCWPCTPVPGNPFFLMVTWSWGRRSRSGGRGAARPNCDETTLGMLWGDTIVHGGHSAQHGTLVSPMLWTDVSMC